MITKPLHICSNEGHTVLTFNIKESLNESAEFIALLEEAVGLHLQFDRFSNPMDSSETHYRADLQGLSDLQLTALALLSLNR